MVFDDGSIHQHTPRKSNQAMRLNYSAIRSEMLLADHSEAAGAKTSLRDHEDGIDVCFDPDQPSFFETKKTRWPLFSMKKNPGGARWPISTGKHVARGDGFFFSDR